MMAEPARKNTYTYSHWDDSASHWDQGSSIWDAKSSAPEGEYKTNASVRNWLQLVRNADKDFDLESTRPVAYEFSNGRKYRHKVNPYETSPGDSHSPGYPGT